MAYSCIECDCSIDGESVDNAEAAAIKHHVDYGHAIERRSGRSGRSNGGITVSSEDADRARSD